MYHLSCSTSNAGPAVPPFEGSPHDFCCAVMKADDSLLDISCRGWRLTGAPSCFSAACLAEHVTAAQTAAAVVEALQHIAPTEPADPLGLNKAAEAVDADEI